MRMLIAVNRAAAIMAGRDIFGEAVVDIDLVELTAEERAILIAAPLSPGRDGIPDLTSEHGNVWPGKYPRQPELPDSDDAIAAARAWLGWRAACLLERKRVAAEAKAKEAEELALRMEEAKAYVAYWIDQPADRFTGRLLPSGSEGEPKPPGRTMGGNSAPESYALEALRGKFEAAAELEHQRIRMENANRLKARAEKEQAEARRAAQIAQWVLDNGTESQIRRQKLGLLPESEVIDAIRSAAYAALAPFGRYRGIESVDINHTDLCAQTGNIVCATADADALTDEQFQRFARIESAAPEGATLKVLAHSCQCSDCDAGVIRPSVNVIITVGELAFAREYALSDC